MAKLSHGSIVSSIAFSPDGKALASGGWGFDIMLWNVAGEKTNLRRSWYGGQVVSLAFSPDGKTLASSNVPGANYVTALDVAVNLWNVGSGKRTGQLAVGKTIPSCVTFSPDGKTLASGYEDGTIRLWSLPREKQPNK